MQNLLLEKPAVKTEMMSVPLGRTVKKKKAVSHAQNQQLQPVVVGRKATHNNEFAHEV